MDDQQRGELFVDVRCRGVGIYDHAICNRVIEKLSNWEIELHIDAKVKLGAAVTRADVLFICRRKACDSITSSQHLRGPSTRIRLSRKAGSPHASLGMTLVKFFSKT